MRPRVHECARRFEAGRRAAIGGLAAAIALASAAGCGKSAPRTPAEEGRIIYMTNCVVCHNLDPNRPGSQGPDIAGASRELVEDRVLHLTYPPGYKPKRTTHAMRTIPGMTQKRIDELAAFLAQAKEPGK